MAAAAMVEQDEDEKLYGPDGLGSQDASVAAAAMVQLLWETRKECSFYVGSTQNLLGPDGAGSQDASKAAAALHRLMVDLEIQPPDGPRTDGLHEQILSEFKRRVLGPDFKKRVFGLCQEGLWSREEDVVMASMQELASMCSRDDDVYRDDRVKAINNVFGFVTICGAMGSWALSANIQTVGCEAIAHALVPPCFADFGAVSVTEIVETVMKNFPEDEELQYWAGMVKMQQEWNRERGV